MAALRTPRQRRLSSPGRRKRKPIPTGVQVDVVALPETAAGGTGGFAGPSDEMGGGIAKGGEGGGAMATSTGSAGAGSVTSSASAVGGDGGFYVGESSGNGGGAGSATVVA